MAKKDLNARVRYSASHDAYVIEIQDQDGSWTLCSAYPFKKVDEKAEYLHYSIVNQILQMIEMGYHIYKSDIID